MGVPAKKLKALVDRESKAKPFGGGGGGKGKQDEAEHGHNEGGDEGEHDHEDGEDEGGDDHDDIDVEEIAQRIADGKGDGKLMKLSRNVDDEHNPPQWVENEDLWEKAKEKVEPNWDSYDEPWAVTSHVYEAMGGSIKAKDKGDGGGGNDHDEE